MKSITFTSKCGNFQCSVTEDWIELHPDYQTVDSITLFQAYGMFQGFHNEHGPALINLDNGGEYYFINGTPIFAEESIAQIKNKTYKVPEKI